MGGDGIPGPVVSTQAVFCQKRLTSDELDPLSFFQVVCKYIDDPVLFMREEVGTVKFDFRYMLMLRSVQPLRLYAYNVFWLRFANR